MKKGIILLSVIALCSCNGGPKTYEEHLERLEENVSSTAIEFKDYWLVEYKDFTGDGIEEMIAVVCEEMDNSEGGWNKYSLYYSTPKALTMCATHDGIFYQEPMIIETENSPIIFYTIGSGSSSGENFGWRCTDDSLVPVAMPGELEQIDGNYFICYRSGFNSFEADYDDDGYWPGRCFYNYYYYFDGEQFTEFGGRSLTERQFREKFGGADILRQLRSSRLTVEEVLYRGNGIIDINCSYRTSQTNSDNVRKSGRAFKYIELIVTDDGLDTIDGLQDGRIKAALTPDFAVYPNL